MESDTSFLLIGALATQANTTKDTIRHYDEMGLLKSRKRQAGSRLYTEFHPECIERIKMIKGAQAIGFTLNEFKRHLNDHFNGTLNIDKDLITISKKLTEAKRQKTEIINTINRLSAYYIILEEIKSDNIGFISKSEWEKRIATQLSLT